MSKERLSKIQKQVLVTTFEDGIFNRGRMRDFLDKKEGIPFTDSERVIIHRTLRNMVQKGLITHLGNWWHFHLTEKGLNVFLKLTKGATVAHSLALRAEYEKRKEGEIEVLRSWKIIK